MIIQDLAETSDGDLEQVKWNILLKYFIFHLENTETYYEGDKKSTYFVQNVSRRKRKLVKVASGEGG